MQDWKQVTNLIAFALERLSERNGQHEFEHICRRIAQLRICVNILPATGPVQGGGDQGRDFETFPSFMSQSGLEDAAFLSRIGDKSLAFACSLNKRIAPKIKSDVSSICGSGSPVDGTHYFCTAPVKVSKRHELQELTKSEYGVDLFIYDCEAISELLAHHDTVWIAESYLSLPPAMVPSPAEEDKSWYGNVLAKWRRTNRKPVNYAEFSEIRSARRVAAGPFEYDSGGKPAEGFSRPEFTFWLDRLEELDRSDVPDQLRRRVVYESVVHRLRCLGSLQGFEGRIRMYFAGTPNCEDAAQLDEADTLLSYVQVASKIGKVELQDNEVDSWAWAIGRRLGELLTAARDSGKTSGLCSLLQVDATILLRDWLVGKDASIPERVLALWSEIMDSIPSATLFPLERFSDEVTEYAGYIGDQPGFDEISQRLDGLLSERFGGFKAAEKCLDRAIAFVRRGDRPKAIVHMHRAKIEWLASERVENAVQCLLLLNTAYTELGLIFAAKQAALAAAFITHKAEALGPKRYMAEALKRAAMWITPVALGTPT